VTNRIGQSKIVGATLQTQNSKQLTLLGSIPDPVRLSYQFLQTPSDFVWVFGTICRSVTRFSGSTVFPASHPELDKACCITLYG
jgi:hypothetical protein